LQFLSIYGIIQQSIPININSALLKKPVKGRKKVIFAKDSGFTQKGIFMKKSKLLVLGLIGLLMVIGLVIAGCKDPADECKGSCFYDRELDSGVDCQDPLYKGYAVCNKTCSAVYANNHKPYIWNVKCDCVLSK
jgi:hypothetical protein